VAVKNSIKVGLLVSLL